MQITSSKRLFDAAAFKREFPGLADSRLHYLDNAATAQMPEVVLAALRRFEVEARANVHEGMHTRARAATEAYYRARALVARFPQRQLRPGDYFHLRHDLVDQLARSLLQRALAAR